VIPGVHVRLVPLDRRHLDATLRWANDPDLMALLDRAWPVSAAEHEQWFEALSGRRDRFYFAIETLADDQHAEICLAVDGWVTEAAAGLRRGVLLLIDYGYPAADLYDPLRRRDGTLRAYLRHRVHDDPYVHVGRQDLTAHVDVTAVGRAATAAGLAHLGTTTQAEFLVGLGTEELLHAIQADPATTMQDYLAVRSALVRLLDPAAMGRFRVMTFGRGWPDGPPLAGLGYRLTR
jgi:SAM-dependent MidA family methyltransferase